MEVFDHFIQDINVTVKPFIPNIFHTEFKSPIVSQSIFYSLKTWFISPFLFKFYLHGPFICLYMQVHRKYKWFLTETRKTSDHKHLSNKPHSKCNKRDGETQSFYCHAIFISLKQERRAPMAMKMHSHCTSFSIH